MEHKIPICQLQSKTLFIDDSEDFLMNFSLQLPDDANYQLHTSPNSAQRLIDNLDDLKLQQIMRPGRIESSGSPLTTQTLQFDISEIHKTIYNPDRFSQVSVLVVDYAMPGMDGITFFKHLKNLPLGKILLTGNADEKVAINAFNDGLIDCYARKNETTVAANIKHNINLLQQRYFRQLSSKFDHLLTIHGEHCLHDDAYAELLEQLVQTYQIVEYYLIDTSGSFLMLDKDANCYFLILKTEEDLRYYHEMAIDSQAPQSVIDDLASGNFFPSCLLVEHGAIQPDWSQPLIPAHTLIGKQPYRYTCLQALEGFELQQENIVPFQTYLEKQLTDLYK